MRDCEESERDERLLSTQPVKCDDAHSGKKRQPARLTIET